MARWQRKLDLKDIWQAAKNGNLPYNELCSEIAQRLTQLRPLQVEEIDEEKEDIAADFHALSKLMPTEDDVNDAYGRLCDWGDLSLDDSWNGKKVCWIRTF